MDPAKARMVFYARRAILLRRNSSFIVGRATDISTLAFAIAFLVPFALLAGKKEAEIYVFIRSLLKAPEPTGSDTITIPVILAQCLTQNSIFWLSVFSDI